MLPVLPAVVVFATTALSIFLPGLEADEGFRALRPPLFGLAIEWRKKDDVYRVVSVDEDGGRRTILSRGTVEECEERLLAALTKRYGTGRRNVVFPTLGGKQLWADQFIYCGWRIQRHVFTGHSRLLDPDDDRRSWGTYRQCRIELEKQRSREKFRPRSKHAVFLVHGLFRSKDSFRKMATALRRRGYDVESITYPSTRQSLREHADQLQRILANLEDYEEVSFVTHSLGGIVVRDLLAREAPWKKKIKVRRLVMLGPPNRGSVVAEVLEDWLPYRVVAGEAALQLTPAGVNKIPPPACTFGIIAGGTGTDIGLNPGLPGDNDGTVLVESTRLDSADDFLVVRCLHSFLMNSDEAIEATARFLKTGKFRR